MHTSPGPKLLMLKIDLPKQINSFLFCVKSTEKYWSKQRKLKHKRCYYLLGWYSKEPIRNLKFKFATYEIQSWHRPQKAINFCSKLVNDQRISNNYFCKNTVAKSFLLKPSKYLILNLKFLQAEMKQNGCLKHYGHISMMSSRFFLN